MSRTTTITGTPEDTTPGVIFKNCAPFIERTSEINNTQIDYAKDLNVAMPMYNLIEYSDNYSKISGSLWKYYRDELNATLTNSESFKSKVNITGKTPADDNTKDVTIAVPFKYLSSF